ncbi:3',5'-cyclic-nucleotide phosphodiesterase [Cronobacter condimenti 1330]|uniref:3',5'-cyclic-nucleotide phosphodiesterase n=1 Tax=Cronobacter condimenti 1330 TaxID=1073999 RepID=K8AD76_9ENTR|nr:3',5'-cyclic-nucleotide phosphodiesterase [Cronobacter condimenti 1330]
MLIAQLSDIHAAPDNLNLTRLDNALTWLTPLNPDVLVLSGDLIDNGWYEGYQRIAERLATFNCRIIILPGNADDRGAMRAVWGPSMWPEAPDNGPLHAVVDTPALRIIGLDSTLEVARRAALTHIFHGFHSSLTVPADGRRCSFYTITFLKVAFRQWMR